MYTAHKPHCEPPHIRYVGVIACDAMTEMSRRRANEETSQKRTKGTDVG